MAVSARTNVGANCPYCAGKRVAVGYNDAATKHPELISEWDVEKNKYSLSHYTAGAHKKVWWKCPQGHSYLTSIPHRLAGNNCPICSGHRVLPGYNDLATTNPEIADEWNVEKNALSPYEVNAGSNKRAWWRCNACGHEWNAIIASRTVGTGCPRCNIRRHTSFPEQAIFYYVHQHFPDALNSYRAIFPRSMELDVFIPSISVGIEYDGSVWHRKKNSDQKKYQICQEHGITLIRVFEEAKEELPCDIAIPIDYSQGKDEGITKAIQKIGIYLNVDFLVNIERDRNEIFKAYLAFVEKRSFAEVYPKIAEEWDTRKMASLTPSMFFANSNDNAWWICSEGHSYQMKISDRAKGNNCPVCSGHRFVKGINDLQTKRPDLASEWDYEKNGGTHPQEYLWRSTKKVWWRCNDCGTTWKTAINIRSGKAGTGCPVCKFSSGIDERDRKRLQQGESLSQNEKVLSEWNYQKNSPLIPEEIAIASHKIVWWICSKGHEWQDSVAHRTRSNRGCPYCANKRVLQGYNDFETIHPELMPEWMLAKNESICLPNAITSGTNVKVWWKCSKCDYEWMAAVSSRTAGTGCPNCYRMRSRKKKGELPFSHSL